MTRAIYYTATTLDGFLADDDDSLEWLFAVDQEHDGFPAFHETIGAIVQGSTTYEWVLRHENLLEEPEKWPGFYGARPTWIFTTRDLPVVPGADVRPVSGDVESQWREIAASAGDRDVWIVGGGDLAGQFADAGLLDEIRLSVAPVTLGSGRPLLPRRFESDRLRLVSVAQNGQFAELTLRVKKRRRIGPDRYLDRSGRIDRFPVRPGDLEALLAHVLPRILSPGEVLNESALNDRLRPITDDVALLRRHLVDHGLVERTRSGTEYALAEPVDN